VRWLEVCACAAIILGASLAIWGFADLLSGDLIRSGAAFVGSLLLLAGSLAGYVAVNRR
jgi:hypothetical protein